MVTLMLTIKRVIRSAPPTPTLTHRNEFQHNDCDGIARTPDNAIATDTANHVHHYHDGQLKKTAATATDVIKLNEKGRAPSNNNTSKKAIHNKHHRPPPLLILSRFQRWRRKTSKHNPIKSENHHQEMRSWL